MSLFDRFMRCFTLPTPEQRYKHIDLDDDSAWKVFWPHVASQLPREGSERRVAPNGEGFIDPAGNIIALTNVADREFWTDIEKAVAC